MRKLFYVFVAVCLTLPLFQCERFDEARPTAERPSAADYEAWLNRGEMKYLPELDSYRVPPEEVRTKIRTYLAGNNSRTNAEYPVTEAIWYIEALPNYYEGKANVSYKQLKFTEHLYYLGNDVNAVVPSTQIDELASTIATQAVADKNAAQCGSSEKNTIYISVSPFTSPDGTIYLKVKIGTGVQCFSPQGDPDPYLEYRSCDFAARGHSWVEIGEGTCGSGPQLNTTRNSADVIADAINSFDEIGGCPLRISYSPTENGFFVNQQISTDIYAEFPYGYQTFLNTNDNQPGDGYRDYWLFSSWDTDLVGRIICLNPDEMSFYYGGAIRVINWYRTNHAAGRDFIACEMWATVLFNPNAIGNTQHGIQVEVGDYVP